MELQGSRNLKFKVDNAVSEIRTLSNTKKKNGGALSSTEIRAILAEEKVPRVVINAAYDLVVKGYLSRPNIAALKRAGVRIPKSWLSPKRKRPPSTTDATGGY
jgi:predicted outer membrane repeat protein